MDARGSVAMHPSGQVDLEPVRLTRVTRAPLGQEMGNFSGNLRDPSSARPLQ
jgi:hypothetical protein